MTHTDLVLRLLGTLVGVVVVFVIAAFWGDRYEDHRSEELGARPNGSDSPSDRICAQSATGDR